MICFDLSGALHSGFGSTAIALGISVTFLDTSVLAFGLTGTHVEASWASSVG